MDVSVSIFSQGHLVLDVALSGSNGCWGQPGSNTVAVDSELRTPVIIILGSVYRACSSHVTLAVNQLFITISLLCELLES